ncbi:MAG: hypothetical protein CFH41_01082 [Alphaproteobacteria bacterium MarineAlpha11_Bin1]|nr:MAG: hypothetical protein CFH41_01082 [Alphaproteobacteria bacterium MarineAlpha11_Bin1]|tara:strand:+ start:2334 stop:3020 length:687 start_codon:yes stop_codon:yes gene_type:complete
MYSALFLAIQQLNDTRIRRLVLRAVVVSAFIFIALVFGITWALNGISFVGIQWIDKGLAFLGGSAAFLISLLIFPTLIGLIISFMLEEIARSVDIRHFPYLPAAREQPTTEVFKNAARFAAIAVGLNLLFFVFILPLMVITIVLSPLIPVVFWGLNGYLLGREYFEFAGLRRVDPQAMRLLRRRNKTRVFVSGIVIAVMMTVPLVNWLMPLVAAAYMVHVFEDVRRRD